MVKRFFPSVEALSSNDDDLLTEELRLEEVCAELAFARTFLDQAERVVGELVQDVRARSVPARL